MSNHALRKIVSLFSILIILANSIIPVFRPLPVYAESPPPTPPAPTSQPPDLSETAEPSAQTLPTPAPGDLPPEAEEARARQAMEATLAKYRDYYGPRLSLELTNLQLESEWAYAVATTGGKANPPNAPAELHLLAKRLPDGEWQALLPDGDDLYRQWLDAAPESLIPAGQKSQLHSQAGAAAALYHPPPAPAVPPPVTSTVAGQVKLPSISGTAGPTPTPTPVLLRENSNLINIQATNTISNILSNGQFVYGPNIGDFKVTEFLSNTAPHLLPYAEELYGRSEYYSINPKVYLTLIEISTQLISNKDVTNDELENPFGFRETGFLTQIDIISNLLLDAYYFHLYQISPLPVEKRNLPSVTLVDGSSLDIPPTINAGTYAVVVALAQLRDASGMSIAFDNTNQNSFYQTYVSLFPDDDPLSESNHIHIPGEIGILAAPADLLQLPYLRGESWQFNGIHSALGNGGSDMSSLDFSPGWPGWNTDTSNMWVAAAAAGVPTKISACNFRITHSDGWETAYYHLENIQNFGGSIQQNDKIGVLANTYDEATCNNGDSSRPHVHFTLKRNGAWVPLDGTALSGWYVHSGRWNYDTDQNYMWLERNGTKKYAWNWLLNDDGSDGTCSAPSLTDPGDGVTLNSKNIIFRWDTPSDCSPNGYTLRVKNTTDMESGGTTYLDTGVGGTSYNCTFDGSGPYCQNAPENTDLYWSVRPIINNQPAGNWATARRFRIDTSPPPASGNWEAKYVEGDTCWWAPDCANWNNPKHTETIPGPTLDKNWGTNSPGGGVSPDNWVGNFEATINFPTGNYVFYLEHDDGVKLWLNGGSPIQDRGGSGSGPVCNGQGGYNLSGNENLRVLLREDGGDAKV